MPSRVPAVLSFSALKALVKNCHVLSAFLILLFVHVQLLSAQAPSAVPVVTWRYDLTHAGQNTNETLLTPSNVNVSTFGKLFSMRVDSTVYAQPLYVPGLTMKDGQIHNVLFVATENDSVYAFDADTNGGANAKPIWQISLLSPAYGAGAGATAVDWHDSGSPDVAPTVGITGTPTINLATNTIYLVAATKENGVYYSRLHAINIIDGTEQPNSPVDITATVPGTGNGSSGGQLAFDPLWENQRTALNYYKGYVYFGYGAHGDDGPWHGWLFAYDATTLKQTAALCTTPNGVGAGIWAAGAGLPIDEDGPGGAARMFLATGNGKPDSPPFNTSHGFGESIAAFDIANGSLNLIDTFTSFNFQTLNNHDWDQGSGGILMVPDNSGPNPHMLIQAGKEGRILVLNRDNLGGYVAGANTNALQEIPPQITPGDGGLIPQSKGFWSTPAYWNGNVYLWAENNVPMLFKLNDGVLGSEPVSMSSITSAFPDPSFSISSNGTENGIAWAVRSDQFNTHGPAVLYAWDANDLTSTIYESDTNAKRDAAGAANKFSIPVVTNGKVYVAANGEVDVYGLFNGEPNAVAPVISPDGGNFASSQTVELSSATASASIYYTLDGSTPTPASTLYTAPITISSDTTVKAVASAPGYVQSGVSTATFSFNSQTPPVTASPAGGSYLTAQTVSLSVADVNARIYYTTDGSTPSSNSRLYTGPIQVGVSETLSAIAIDTALQNSDIDREIYVIQNGGTSIDFEYGFSSTAGLTLNGSTVANNDTRLQLTNGGLNQAGSVFWNAPINIQAFSTTFEFQLSAAQGNGFTFTIQNIGPTALGGNSAGLGYQGVQKSVAIKFNFYNYQNEGDDSTGIYINGQSPVLPSVDLTPSGIVLASGDSIQAQVQYDGTTLTLSLLDLVTSHKFTMSQAINIPQIVGGNTAYVGFTGGTGGLSSSQKILTWTYTTQAVPPIFSPSAGTYVIPQSVSLSSATSDAVIYYTTDGSKPSAASMRYSGPIQVAQSEAVQAIAISRTYGSSSVVSAAYVIQNIQPSGTFSLNASQTTPVTPGTVATSNITITPQNGFIGSVALSCAVSAEPSGATDLPTCSVTELTPVPGSPVIARLTVNTQAGTTPGTYTITVTGTSGGQTAATSIQITLTSPAAAPQFTLSGSSISIPSAGGTGSSVITITPSGGFTGNVAVTCTITGQPAGTSNPPTCSISQPQPIAGTQAVSATLTVSANGAAPGTYNVTVTGNSAGQTATTSIQVTLTPPAATPQFTLNGSGISIPSAGGTGSSVITITPSGGFTGGIALSCAITGQPAGAVNPPTCSVNQPQPIAGAQAVSATLTVSTSGATTALLNRIKGGPLGWGGGVLAALIFFCVPIPRRKWQTIVCLLLAGIIVAAAGGCGSGGSSAANSSNPSKPSDPTNTATTSGTYTITVTGTSGTEHATATIAVTVQ
jgi:hypothetical protein